MKITDLELALAKQQAAKFLPMKYVPHEDESITDLLTTKDVHIPKLPAKKKRDLPRGVYLAPNGKYRARATVKKCCVVYGTFSKLEDAIKARSAKIPVKPRFMPTPNGVVCSHQF